jgi:hypothetical protein
MNGYCLYEIMIGCCLYERVCLTVICVEENYWLLFILEKNDWLLFACMGKKVCRF